MERAVTLGQEFIGITRQKGESGYLRSAINTIQAKARRNNEDM